VYFGAGYVDLPTTFKLGGVLGVVNLLIWGVIGGAWWKFIGLY
jgi:DASS family divalent anion:Na+ symporter